MIFAIPELLEEVLARVDDPTAFASVLRVNKEWSRIARSLIPRKKLEFLRDYSYQDKQGFRHQVKRYPNKTKHGSEEIYEGPLLRASRTWVEGVLDGTEEVYDDLGQIIQEIPWIRGLKHGTQTKRHGNGTTSYKYWVQGQLTSKEVFDQQQRLQARNAYSGPKTFVHYERDPQGQLVREGVYVNKEKHGIYQEQGKPFLYIHGVKQLWYTPSKLGMLVYASLALFFIGIIVWCYSQRSLNPAIRFYYLVMLAVTLIVIPLAWGLWRGGRILFTPT